MLDNIIRLSIRHRWIVLFVVLGLATVALLGVALAFLRDRPRSPLPGAGDSSWPRISDDGSIVVFGSYAGNLVRRPKALRWAAWCVAWNSA